MTVVLIAIVVAIVSLGAGFFLRKVLADTKLASLELDSEKVKAEAAREIETIRRTADVEAREKLQQIREEAENELKQRRAEVLKGEQRLEDKEKMLTDRERDLQRREQSLADREVNTKRVSEELEQALKEQRQQLERVSGLTSIQAKDLLLKQVEEEARHDMAKLIRFVEEEAKRESDRRARNILSLSIQRTAANHSAETTVSVVPLPSDEMKGRIIGREGRNIRALENISGIDVIIDDTPEAVVLSGFDGVKREIARLTLTKLLGDGRIHPARIEDTYKQAKAEVERAIMEAGEQATLEANVHGLPENLVKLLGRLKYRTSYGQNVLSHSLEVSHVAGIMAAELGASAKLVRRAGLLHDIGKAVDHQIEGTHAGIGANLAKKNKEGQAIWHAIEAHHGDVEPQTVEAVLVQAADAVSAARPGARRDSLESYIKRLESLESIALSKNGVEKCYVMQAGREIRVMVKPGEVDDDEAALLSREIAKEIEKQLDYPGQIKVTVIRESRATEFAK
ncbi:MAG: ribonuclease Y [Actinomycetota bacterium]|nr:ribonuclease Y [Actinomycetota bacterium]MDA8168042.1 ribonuclease Y [Actinomycetota bacterium]